MKGNSFKHFIEHSTGMKKISTFKHKQSRLRFKHDQLAISGLIIAKYHNFKLQLNIKTQAIQRINRLGNKPKSMKSKREREDRLRLES